MSSYSFAGGPHDGLSLTREEVARVGFIRPDPRGGPGTARLLVALPNGEALPKVLAGDVRFALPEDYDPESRAGHLTVYVIENPADPGERKCVYVPPAA